MPLPQKVVTISKWRDARIWPPDRRERGRKRGSPAHAASHSPGSPFLPGACVHPFGDKSTDDATALCPVGEPTQNLVSFSNSNTSRPKGGSLRLGGKLRAGIETGTFLGSSGQGGQPLAVPSQGRKQRLAPDS